MHRLAPQNARFRLAAINCETHTSQSPRNGTNVTMPDDHPLAVLQTESPDFSAQDAIDIVRKHYAVDATVEELVSERDQNFRLQLADGRQFVLKIASTMEDPQVTDFQIKALLHLQQWQDGNKFQINAPQILPTTEGATHMKLTSSVGQHVARVVTYVAGVPLGDEIPSLALCENMGAYLARLGLALKDFRHPGNSQALLWDLQKALDLRELLPYIKNETLRHRVDETLNEFEQHAYPHFAQLRTQVIHSDFNPDNVLIASPGADEVSGVIDFGDMLSSPLIADVAIGASYLRPVQGNPLCQMGEFLAGYHHVTALTQAELDILFTLIKARLAASVSIIYWRASAKDADDAYLAKLKKSESPAGDFLCKLCEIPRASAAQTFKQICASTKLRSA